jgi:hypothetical protein
LIQANDPIFAGLTPGTAQNKLLAKGYDRRLHIILQTQTAISSLAKWRQFITVQIFIAGKARELLRFEAFC